MEGLFYFVCFVILLCFTGLIFLKKKTLLSTKNIPVPCSTMIILGSGGHTTEMLTMAMKLDPHLYSPRIYILAHSDTLSRMKVTQMEEARGAPEGSYIIDTVYRVREVGQSWVSTVLKSLPVAIQQSANVLKCYSPSMILCNGPGLCVPICCLAAILRSFGNYSCVMVYVESICRVTHLSMTGKILRFIVDHFFVQWPELLQDYSKYNMIYIGRIS